MLKLDTLDIVTSLDTEYTFKELELKLEATYKSIILSDFTKIGSEDFGNAITRFFAGIGNILFHMIHTFKTNIFKFYKTLTRTELVYYKESNELSFRRILNCDYEMVKELSVPVPHKFNSTYLIATQNILDFLDTLDLKARLNLYEKHVEDLKNKVLSSDIHSDDLIIMPIEDLPGITTKFKITNNNFNGSFVREKKFKEVFTSPTDLSATVDFLLNKGADYQYEVSSIMSSLDSIANEFDTILSFLQKNKGTMSKNQLMDLSKLTMGLAKFFDMYGVVIQDLSKVDHNTIEVLKVIRNQFNL